MDIRFFGPQGQPSLIGISYAWTGFAVTNGLLTGNVLWLAHLLLIRFRHLWEVAVPPPDKISWFGAAGLSGFQPPLLSGL